MFSQASVILFTAWRGVCGRHPRAHTPLGRHPLTPGQAPLDIPPDRHLTRADTPSWPVHAGTQTPLQSACWGTHPTPSACRGTPNGGQCSGRCASYWNAFLLEIETKSLLSPHNFLWSLTSAFPIINIIIYWKTSSMGSELCVACLEQGDVFTGGGWLPSMHHR